MKDKKIASYQERRLWLINEMKKQLKWKRFIHTMSVAGVAASLAMRYGEDVSAAEEAAILHDCAKYLDVSRMEELVLEAGLSISNVEKGSPSLLHSKAGAILAAREYGVIDNNIIEAIRWHTTGRPGMSMLEKIIFTADYIEPGRQIPGLSAVRALAFTDIDRAVLMILDRTLDYLNETCSDIDEMTQKTFDYYREINEDE